MAQSMDSAVHLRAAVATSGRFPVLAGVDLEVAGGEFVVVDGPNGAGKTSLLRACAGLLPLSDGEGTVLGLDLRRQAQAVRRLVGMQGHASSVYDELTSWENLRFSLRAAGASTSGARQVLERFGLGGRLATTPAGRLSAGQRRRLGLAALAARAPRLWLLDEPHASLDAGGRALLGGLLEEALAAGASVIVASHEPLAATEMADRVLSMAGGRVVASRRGGRRRVLPGGAHVA